jgi:2-dehydropantoate 2-reductase
MANQDELDLTLNVLVFGAGAIGSYIGGSLALFHHHVIFLEQPAVVEQLRQTGLSLQLNSKDHRIENLQFFASLDEALDSGPLDVSICALKSYDTKSILEALSLRQDRMPPVLCLQNGVDNESALSAVLGPKKVIAGTVTSAVRRVTAGDVILERLRGIGIAGGSDLHHCLVKAFNDAGLNARLYRHAEDMKWSKMITNLLANATSAILDMTPAEIFDNPRLFRLEIAQLREALRVMAAAHIQPVDLPDTPVRALVFAVQRLPLAIARTLLKNAVGSGRGGKMPSFYIDLHSGRGKSEVDFLNGAVVRHGERLGIHTPVNQFLNETLLALTRGELALDSYARQPEKLLADLPG